MSSFDGCILSMVTFIPLAGAVLLLLFPRRDRDIRVFSLVVSLLTFAISLHLPVHFHRHLSGFQFEVNHPWIPRPTFITTWVRTAFPCAGRSHHVSHAFVRTDFLEVHQRASERVLHPAAGLETR